MRTSTLVAVFFCALPLQAAAQQATIRVSVERTIGEVDRDIYGVFMEPIRNTMDGLLYDPSHPLANEDGFRTDYIEAAHELELTNMRWPGGNYTATYDWRDGIGPQDERPVRRELAWGVLDSNGVGTDEWLTLAQAMDVESSITINGGRDTHMSRCGWGNPRAHPQGAGLCPLDPFAEPARAKSACLSFSTFISES